MSARKIQDVVIYRDEDYYCGPGPAAIAFPDGEIVVFFRRHRSWTPEPFFAHVHPTTEMCLTRSKDRGETWQDPPRVFEGGGQCAGAALLSDGVALFTTHRMEVVGNAMADGPPNQDSGQVSEQLRERRDWSGLAAGTEFWRSDDRCETWHGPVWVGDVPGVPPKAQGLHSPVQHRGFPVELSDGSIAMTVQARGVGSILVVSEDRGATWNYRSVAARCTDADPENAFNEWTLRETPSGAFVGFFRCHLPVEQGGRYLWTARSEDRGHTWSEPRREDAWGHPFYPLPLPSGQALLVYGHRRDPFGIRCRVIDPECERIGEAEEIVLRDDGGGADLGYPHAAMLPDGRVLVVYYFHDREGGQRHVAGTFVEVE